MAYLKSLKQDVSALKEQFPENHERFRISQTTSDQLTCRFIGENGKNYDIHAVIPDLFPTESIIWYTDSDEKGITEVVDKLSDTNRNKSISDQINTLLRGLCHLHNVKIPNEAASPPNGECSRSGSVEVSSAQAIETPKDGICEEKPADDSDADEADSDMDDLNSDHFDFDSDVSDDCSEPAEEEDTEPLVKRALVKLEKTKTGSNEATSRLMKELLEIYRSATFKNEEYSINLVNDCIYEWEVELRSVDRDSALYKDLRKLKEKEGKDCILLHMKFDQKYPIEPPFVRVVYPIMKCKHIVGGGAICTELLLKQCWSPAYTVETVIVQLAALFVKGNARIDFDSKTRYSFSAARWGFGEVTGAKKSGWFDRFKESS